MKIKHLIRLGIVAILSLGMIGCSILSTTKKTEGFDEFMDSLAISFVSADDMNLNYMFIDPSKYGITRTDAVLPFVGEEEFADNMAEIEKQIANLESYNYKKLSAEQQLTYDVTMDSLKSSLALKDHYYLTQNYLGSFIGFQAQLPLLLGDWNMNDAQDIRSYLNLLKKMPETFKQYAELEMKRQEKGVGMGQTILDKIIAQCESVLTNRENYFLIDKFNQRINALTFLTETEKQDYIAQNKELMDSGYFEGYKVLKEELSKIDGKKFNNLGIGATKEGKKYYEILAKQASGSDMDIKAMKKYLNKKASNALFNIQTLALKNKEPLNKIVTGEYYFTDLTNGEEVLSYILQQMQNDFPNARNIPHNMSKVDDSMKDNFSPAAYMTTRIDATDANLEKIYINADYTDRFYQTYAHEGYPGHMYQSVYYRDYKHPLIRNMLDYNGYSEGWGTYAEMFSTKYAMDDQIVYKLLRYNSEYLFAQLCLLDIGIHYENWTSEEVFAFLRELNPEISDEDCLSQFEIQLETPTNYLSYYMGYFHLSDLSEMMEKELKDKYQPMLYHEIILNTGPAPYSILEKQVKSAIQNLK